jgi:hypothetical protein
MERCPNCTERVAFEIKLRESLFDRTGNPLYAWAALREAHNAGLEIPDWVTEYLYEASFGLLTDARNPITGETVVVAHEDLSDERDQNRWAAVALNLASPGRGKETRRAEFARLERDLAIAFAIGELIRGDQAIGVWKAAQSVAKRFGVSPDVARGAYESFRAWIAEPLAPNGDLNRVIEPPSD